MKKKDLKEEASGELYAHAMEKPEQIQNSNLIRVARRATDTVFRDEKYRIQTFLVAAIRTKIKSAERLMGYFEKLEKKILSDDTIDNAENVREILSIYERLLERFESIFDKLTEYRNYLSDDVNPGKAWPTFGAYVPKGKKEPTDAEADNLVESGIINSDSRKKLQVAYSIVTRLSASLQKDGTLSEIGVDEEIQENAQSEEAIDV